jgi:hypothetical protein
MTKAEAIVAGSKRYLGHPCPHGHVPWRYVSSDQCCACHWWRIRHMRGTPTNEDPPPMVLTRRIVPAPVTGSAFIAALPLGRLMAGR